MIIEDGLKLLLCGERVGVRGVISNRDFFKRRVLQVEKFSGVREFVARVADVGFSA
jgi:hypothetical protein